MLSRRRGSRRVGVGLVVVTGFGADNEGFTLGRAAWAVEAEDEAMKGGVEGVRWWGRDGVVPIEPADDS